MVSYGGLTFEGCVVRVADGVAQNASVIRAVVLSQEIAKAVIAELTGAYEGLTVEESSGENAATVHITSMSTQEVAKMVDRIEMVEELDKFEEEEKNNEDYRFLGGRKGVLQVIQARREKILGQ